MNEVSWRMKISKIDRYSRRCIVALEELDPQEDFAKAVMYWDYSIEDTADKVGQIYQVTVRRVE